MFDKTLDRAVCRIAATLFNSIQFINQYHPHASFTPTWSDRPLLKSWQRSKPPLGWPRETDSLCPGCVKEAREAIIQERQDWRSLLSEKVGEIKAHIIERDGQIWMVKDCPVHGHYEDLISLDPEFQRWIENHFPGRDIPAHHDASLHDHGSSSIRHGRGTVLTVDLTNRCNMMCDPCFMDANQVGFVHELSWEDIKQILDNAIEIKPRRQMSVQFSGGEPTLSPYFLDAIRYARQLGYNGVQAASNGIEFAKSPEFCRRAFEAGLRYVYLQFDGIGEDANRHRKVGNLFDVKTQAIENLHNAGVEIFLVITLVNTVNDDQVGPILRFAMENPKKIALVSFQPVSFTGRDEDITPERRLRQRYTSSHLARDVSRQLGRVDPVRHWFPVSVLSVFADFGDLVHGPQAHWGEFSCNCHPDCGVGTAVMVNKQNGDWAPVAQFVDVPQLVQDTQRITDAARGPRVSNLLMGLALLKNYHPAEAPPSLHLADILKKFDKTFWTKGVDKAEKDYGAFGPERTYEDAVKRRQDPWNFLFIAGMWFQDLFNYDFRRTEMCVIPYGTQQGEISFCAYNTGIGWRKIIENMHKNATVAEWYKTHGKHSIYAKGQAVALPTTQHSLQVNATDAAHVRERRHDVPMTASEEDRLRRKKAMEEEARIRGIYEELMLKKPRPTLVQIGTADDAEEKDAPVPVGH